MPLDMNTRKCGCIDYEYGPPLVCPKHQKAEEKGLRKAVRDQAEALGHKLNQFLEYESRAGKWTTFCQYCERIVIVYDTPPDVGDQIAGKILEGVCKP